MTGISTSSRPWVKLVWRLSIGLILALCVIAALVIALVANNSANRTASCVNDVLGDRNGTSASDAGAHIRFAAASKRYDDALARVVQAAPSSSEQQAAYRAFVSAARDKQDADDTYIRDLTSSQRFRAAHPLGRC